MCILLIAFLVPQVYIPNVAYLGPSPRYQLYPAVIVITEAPQAAPCLLLKPSSGPRMNSTLTILQPSIVVLAPTSSPRSVALASQEMPNPTT